VHVARLEQRGAAVRSLELGALWSNHVKSPDERNAFISSLETRFAKLSSVAFGVPPWSSMHIKLERVAKLTLHIPRDYTFSTKESGCSFHCPALTSFELKGVSDISFVTDTLFNALSACPTITDVSLSTNGDIAPRASATMVFPHVLRLTLRLLPDPWTARVITKLHHFVDPFPNLKHLEIIDESDATVRGSLVDTLGQLPTSLETIRLVGLVESRHAGLARWNFPLLSSMELISCRIGSVLQEFVAPRLEFLSLMGSIIDDGTLHQMLSSSEKGSLTHLWLSQSNVASIPSLEACPALHFIALDGCTITRSMAAALVQETQLTRILVSKGADLPPRLGKLKAIYAV
jgi:hypothetical protein